MPLPSVEVTDAADAAGTTPSTINAATPTAATGFNHLCITLMLLCHFL
jgi:hypothetical protein